MSRQTSSSTEAVSFGLCQLSRFYNFQDNLKMSASSEFPRTRKKGKEDSHQDKNNDDDRAKTLEMLRKLQQLEDNASKTNTQLVVADSSMRKSASFQNIRELSEDCSFDFKRRGSDPRSIPESSANSRRTPGGRRQKPWELRRSSTPIPGELDVSSVLCKALGRFSPKVGHTSVKEKEELDD